MAAFKIEKTGTPDTGDFDETIDFAVLQCTNVTGNNNKFYCIEIQKNPKTGNFRLYSHYGRLESSSVYEKRETSGSGEVLTELVCRAEYDKIIKKKIRGKNVKRGDEIIREAYAEVDVVSPSVGSNNICNTSTVKIASAGTPMIDTSNHDTESGRIVRMIVNENIHNITNNTSFKFTAQGFETALGPVTEQHLDRASDALDSLRDVINGKKVDDTKLKDANSEYLTLVPRGVSHVINKSDMVISPDDLVEEYDLLDNLRTAVKTGLNANNDDKDDKCNIHITQMSKNDSEYIRLEDKFESTKHRNHAGISGYHVKNIFNLDVPQVSDSFAPMEEKIGNVKELFHGTKTANLLSISLNGLIIPPTGAAHVTGRMFGNGVYAASCSTKALNYAVGYWGGASNRTNTAFVLIVQFAMGKEYEVKSHLYSGAPSGYDSLWARSGQALLNDEFIVYNLNQIKITHLLELES